MKAAFLNYYLYTFIQPRRTFDRLLSDKNKLIYSIFFVSIPAVLYTFMYIFLTIGGGAPSSFTPWLNIPKEVYYSYNRFLVAPSFFMCWIFASGVVQLLSHLFRGKGSFEDTLSVLGLGISVAMWSTLLHDLIMSFLSAVHIISAAEHEIAMNTPTIWRTIIWSCMSIYLIWFVVLFSKAVAAAHELRIKASVLLGVIGFAAFQVVFFIFNR